jgi:hypothetical protein
VAAQSLLLIAGKPAMPKIDVAATPERQGSGYPPPFDAPCAERVRQRLGNAGGLMDFGVNLMRLPPGNWSSQRHWHSHEDEFVYLLEGELVLIEDGGETVLRARTTAPHTGGCSPFDRSSPLGVRKGRGGPAMTLQNFAQLGTAISGLSVFITFIYLAIQLRDNTRAVRASTFQQVVNSFAGISFDIASDPKLVDLYLRAGKDFRGLGELEQAQYSLMLLSFLRRAENVFVQDEIHTLHEEHWAGIHESITAIMASPGARACWGEIRNRLNPQFRAFIDEMIAEPAT